MARYAAVDIGSNSLRMMVAETNPGEPPKILAVDRQITRLGESVFRAGQISEEAMDLVESVLRRMASTYQQWDVAGLRAVATSAVRDASNQGQFLERAAEALNAPIEVISGQEEARLIHLGVQSRWPHPNHRLLIVDVGGGSAELIVGDHGQMQDGVSKPLGAVRLSEVFLKSDPPAEVELRRMERFVEDKLSAAFDQFGPLQYDRTVATSASAAAVVCAINRVPRARRDEADRLRATTRQLRKLYGAMSEMSLAERKKVTGVGPRRAEIIVPGLFVFLKTLQLFQVPALYYSTAGVRDGIIADLTAQGEGVTVSRLSQDQRRTVEEMSRRYGVSLRHVRKVASLGNSMFDQLAPLHNLAAPYGRVLEAAAYLHDIGHFVSDVGHHKHSYYLVIHSELPGFQEQERAMVASLCRYHRKAMPSQRHEAFTKLSDDQRQALLRLIPLLRIADALDHGQEQRVQGLTCQIAPSQVALCLQAGPEADMQQWAAERAGAAFQQVYGRGLLVLRMPCAREAV